MTIGVPHAVGFLQWRVGRLVECLQVEGLRGLGLGFENFRIGFDQFWISGPSDFVGVGERGLDLGVRAGVGGPHIYLLAFF